MSYCHMPGIFIPGNLFLSKVNSCAYKYIIVNIEHIFKKVSV